MEIQSPGIGYFVRFNASLRSPTAENCIFEAMSNRTIWRIVLFGGLSIIGILGFQTYWFLRTWDFKDQEFQQSVHIALINVAREIARYNKSELPTYDLVKKLNSNYYVVNVNDAIDAGALEYYLRKEFEAVALSTDFEYAIYDCASDRMVYGNYCTFNDKEPSNLQENTLPKYDQFLYYFGVRFPRTNKFHPGKHTGSSGFFRHSLDHDPLFPLLALYYSPAKAIVRAPEGFYQQHDSRV
ncbi:MAG: hypothetical protein IPJ06_20850 [Saprospiraceae bacterium]|nr:hypothetical protein [Saprospiraceae bacterium]